jgi:hypothetical protein
VTAPWVTVKGEELKRSRKRRVEDIPGRGGQGILRQTDERSLQKLAARLGRGANRNKIAVGKAQAEVMICGSVLGQGPARGLVVQTQMVGVDVAMKKGGGDHQQKNGAPESLLAGFHLESHVIKTGRIASNGWRIDLKDQGLRIHGSNFLPNRAKIDSGAEVDRRQPTGGEAR